MPVLERKHFTLNFVQNDENDSSRSTNKMSQELAILLQARSISLHFGWHVQNDSSSTRYPFYLRFSNFANHFLPANNITVFKFQKKMILVRFKNDSRSTRYAFCLRFSVKLCKSFLCCQINLSFKLAIQVSEGTHLTFSFRSMLQRPTNSYSNWQLLVFRMFDWKSQKLADLSLKWWAQHQIVP